MSKFTTEVRFICEIESGLKASVGLDNVKEVIDKSHQKIFGVDSYPIFDVNYSSVIESKILMHYYTKEIGFETVGLWKFKLRVRMNEIMPYFNQLYKSALLSFDPFKDTDITTTHENKGELKQDNNGTGETIGSTTKKDKNLFSNTPQGSLANVEEMTYLTDATIIDGVSGIKNNDTTTNHTESNTVENYLENITGKRGSESYSDLILKYRETFTNIDLMVIDKLQDLFINLWE